MMGKTVLAALLLAITLTTTAYPADLSIGLGAGVTTLDPHGFNNSPNNSVAEQIFDSLIRRNARLVLAPGLAESWQMIDELTWEFRLRRGVRFHDGSEFTAADVVFSLDRPRGLAQMRPPPPGGFLAYTQAITEKIVVDPYTIRLKTAAPYPYMPADLMHVMIVSSRAAAGRHGPDFDDSKTTQGTGPFRFLSFVDGRIELERNDHYWGTKSPWKKVSFLPITKDGPRVAALLAGDVQMIDNVPTADFARLRASGNFNVFLTTSSRMVHLQLDSSRDKSPFVTDRAGKPLDSNPLKDVRVRKAISRAIDRQAIVSRVMDGLARSAGQMIPEEFDVASPNLKPEPYDPGGARKLLAEAGYAEGFHLVLIGPNDRLVNGGRVMQTIAQMLARVGITARVDAMPFVSYQRTARAMEFSAALQSWGATNESTMPLRFIAATVDGKKGLGGSNFGRYSNPKADVLLEQAFATIDNSARIRLLQRATELVIDDYGIIPVHFQVNTWAARKPLVYEPRADERTYAHEVRPGK